MSRAHPAAAVALAVVAAISSACSQAGASGGVGRASPAPSTRSADPATSAPGAPPGAGVPAMLFAGSTGLAVSGRDRPLDRTSLGLPSGTWQTTAAAGPAGVILLVSTAGQAPATVVVGQQVGARVEPRWVVTLPASVGSTVLPGCVSGDGRAVLIADGLVYLDADRVAGTHDVPGTAGRCQLLDDGGVAYLAEVEHAVSIWRPGDDSVVVTSTRCDDFAAGGREMACVDGAGDVLIGPLVAPHTGEPAFDARGPDHLRGPARQVLLSPSGDWLAVVARDGAAVALYRLTGGRVVALGGTTLLPGEALLGFLGP